MSVSAVSVVVRTTDHDAAIQRYKRLLGPPVPRIAGDVTAGPALVSCVLVSCAPCVERCRFLICSGAASASRRDCLMGVQLGFGQSNSPCFAVCGHGGSSPACRLPPAPGDRRF